MCVILLILQPLSITNIILSNNARDITIASVLLRPVKLLIVAILCNLFFFFLFYFGRYVSSFYFNIV